MNTSTGPTGATGNGIQYISLDACCNLRFFTTNRQCISESLSGCIPSITGPTGATIKFAAMNECGD